MIKDSKGKPAVEARGARNFKIVLADEARAAAFSEYLTGKIDQLLKDFEQQEQKVTQSMETSK